ncbi:MAG: preprotein translocase subunit SecG [Candidatus Eremiobacteraeota bacterium]|nr:preprotein translocase subunit SecG [Candidatus Eremiobacteraeota bacterium]MBV9736581.1 preprotein translocase subunit SecG [Candidatus Eremiobacteraeota bacterium]
MIDLLLAATSGPIATPPPAGPNLTPSAIPHTWFAQHASWLTHAFAGLAIIFALALIFLLAIQTTKQEGLSGTIGGRVESAYRGRLGVEENLKRITGFVAVCLVVFWAILSLTGI